MSHYSEIMAGNVNKYVDKKPEDVNPNVDNAAGGQAMRLARHDEIVKRMTSRIYANIPDASALESQRAAENALDALLTAVVELGVGVVALNDYPRMVLQLEEKQP